jgi:hypothetical protein
MQTKQIIIATVVLCSCFLSIMALVTRVLWHRNSKSTSDDMHITDGNDEHHQLSKISASWRRMFASKQDQVKGRWAPTLSAMIKAGDEGLFSSALFANLHGHPGELPLQALYEVFAEELRQRPMTERSAYPGDISRFLSTTNKRAAIGPKRVQSLSRRTTGRLDGQNKSQRKSLDISLVEKGLTRSMSVKKPPPLLVAMMNGLCGSDRDGAPQTSWMKEGRISKSQHGSMSMVVTPAELIALSIVLGSPLNSNGKSDITHSQKGACNISIFQSVTEDGKHQITLLQHKRSISQMPACGSSFSLLFAKHMATGSLPHSQDRHGVTSIIITTDTLKAVQAGSPIRLHKSKVKTPQSRLLASLPNSCEVNFQATSVSSDPQLAGPLIDSISTLPFLGGLVPLASMPLINTVQFVASGGLPPGRLLQRLEGLIDKVNQYAPHLDIFGPIYEPHNAALLYRERERLGRLATGANTSDSIADKAARMQRYITLLERLMALVPSMKSQEVMAAVQEATKKEIYLSYSNAIDSYQKTCSAEPSIVHSDTANFDAHTKRLSTQTPLRSNRSSDASTLIVVSPRSSAGPSMMNLGKQVEQFLKAELPLSVEAVAAVVRMVIVAWTLSVEAVAWEEGEQGFRIPNLDDFPDNIVMF